MLESRRSNVFLGAALAAFACLPAPLPAAEQVNFVLINIDDLGYADVGAFGSKINRTPHIDRLAAEGMRFTSFYAAPVCSASRAALLTGCYPKRVGISAVLFPAESIGLSAAEETLPELLGERGYATACIGKWHLGDQPEFLPTRHGFDQFFGLPYSNDMGPATDGARSSVDEAPPVAGGRRIPGRIPSNHPPLPLLRGETVVARVDRALQQTLVDRYTDEAVRFIEAQRDQPFFLYLPYSAVHWPLYPSEKFRGRSPHGLYSDWVEEVDAAVGRVVDELDRQGLAGRTLVLFTSDNGGTSRADNGPLRGIKASTSEGGIRVPLIARWPRKIPAGTRCDALSSNMDLLPTLVRLAGGRVPTARPIDGHDLGPLLAGAAQNSPYEVFYYFKNQTLQAVRRESWKLSLVDGALYDLESDVGETKNVAADHPAVVAALQADVAACDRDLGATGTGPGCRPAGNVSRFAARPIIDHDGTISAAFAAPSREFITAK